jgi:hypothetical protein
MKKIVIALVIIVIGIQFIPASRTNPVVVSDFDGPAEVKAILKAGLHAFSSLSLRLPSEPARRSLGEGGRSG